MKKAKRRPSGLLWSRFSDERSSKAAWTLIDGNFVSVSVPAGSTHRFAVEEIARKASPPIAVESLCDELSCHRYIRGAVFFGNVGDKLDQIATNYADMRWWISDKGLNLAILPPERAKLMPFDEFAGNLVVRHWKNGKLSKEDLYNIAHAIDDAGFTMETVLQPAQWAPLAKHNINYSKNAIKTFHGAVRNPSFVRPIRRRLYLARTRFKQAVPPGSNPRAFST